MPRGPSETAVMERGTDTKTHSRQVPAAPQAAPIHAPSSHPFNQRMAFAPGQVPGSSPPWLTSAEPDAPAAPSSMALATAAPPLNPLLNPAGFHHMPTLLQSNERMSHTATTSHGKSHLTLDALPTGPPWLSEPGVLQVPPRPHSGPSFRSTQAHIPQRTPSFHSVPDAHALHASHPLHQISPTRHDAPSPHHPFHPLNPTPAHAIPPSRFLTPAHQQSVPEQPAFDQPPFQWAPSSNPWPLEHPLSAPETDNSLSLAPVTAAAPSSDAADLADAYRGWAFNAPLSNVNWSTTQATQDNNFLPSSTVRSPSPYPLSEQTDGWRGQPGTASDPAHITAHSHEQLTHSLSHGRTHTAGAPHAASQAPRMWPYHASDAPAPTMTPYSESPTWPTLYPKASNMSCLRRLLESSADSKQAVSAALQHTSNDFSPGLPGLTKLVSLFTKQGKWRKALAIFDVLGNLGLAPDLVITNAALGACARGADTSRLWQLLSDLLGKGHVPDAITYKGAISALAKNAEGATSLALISTCAKARQWQLSEEILLCTISDKVASEFLRRVGAPDSSRMHENDHKLLVRLQNWRNARDVEGRSTPPLDTLASRAAFTSASAHMHSRSSTPHAAGDHHINPFSSGGMTEDHDSTNVPPHPCSTTATSTAQEQPGPPTMSSLQPTNPPAVVNAISAAAEGKKRSSTSGQSVPQNDSSSVTPRSATGDVAAAAGMQGVTEAEFLFSRTCCNALLIAYKIAEPTQCQRVVALLSVMTEMGGVLSPDIISFNSVIEALGAAGRAADALALLPVLRCAELQATVTTMEALVSISFHGGMLNEVVSLWRDITQCGMRPSPQTLNMFLTALISLGRAHDAFEQYQVILRHPQTYSITADTLSLVLFGCLETRDVAAALHVVHDATMMGLPLHLDAVLKLVEVLQDRGLHDAAMHLRHTLPDQQPR